MTWKQEAELRSVSTLSVSIQTPWCPFLLPTAMPGGCLGCHWHQVVQAWLHSGTGSEAELQHTFQKQGAPVFRNSERVKHIPAFSGRAVMLLIEIYRSKGSFRVNGQPEAKVEENTKKSQRHKQNTQVQVCLLKVTHELQSRKFWEENPDCGNQTW